VIPGTGSTAADVVCLATHDGDLKVEREMEVPVAVARGLEEMAVETKAGWNLVRKLPKELLAAGRLPFIPVP
jgi:hypothetical protein